MSAPSPTPRLANDSPIAVTSAKVLFRGHSIRHRQFGSLRRLDRGRLLLAFRLGRGPDRENDGAVMLSYSDDGGHTWDEPIPLYVYTGWDCLLMGGLCRFSDDLIRLVVGRIRLDTSIPGDEPATGWYVTSIDSRDGGRTWSEPGPEIRLFPGWTELYGASNPHRLSDGRYLLAVIGTVGRDDGWQAGVAFCDANGDNLTGPVIAAAAPNRDFADADVVRLDDGRFLMVCREMVTRDSFQCWSANDGLTWTPARPTGFKGANVKLHKLRSGSVLCAYRDEDPARRGISVSVTDDGGETWRFVGQLYDAGPDVAHRPVTVCGYPDMVYVSEREIACVLHTYPGADGNADLHFLTLLDRTTASGRM